MPEPEFKDNWKQEQYVRNVQRGVLVLQGGEKVVIHDDGRGYELALAIKNEFILQYQRQLAERIKITGGQEITIQINK